MNITNWLCENFDKKRKGYVELKDIWFVVPVGLFSIGYFCAYVFALYDYLYNGFDFCAKLNTNYFYIPSIILAIGSAFLLVVFMLISLVVLRDVINALGTIKIVECKRGINIECERDIEEE